MNAKLLLAFIVLVEPLRDAFGDPNISVGSVAEQKARLSRRGRPGPSGPSVLPGLGQVEAKTKDIISHTQKLIDLMSAISQRQDFFLDLCRKVQVSQEEVKTSVQKVIKVATNASSNTAEIKKNQDVILNNQGRILIRISAQHKETRKSIVQTEKTLGNGMAKLIQTQVKIISSLQKSEDAIAAGFDTLEQAELRTQNLNSQVLKAVEESAVANAQGQANITAELKETRQVAVKALDQALSRQKAILERISRAEKSELDKLEQVQVNMLNVLKLIKESQKAVQRSIQASIGFERDTQILVHETQKVIQRELGEHKQDQGDTQHLAKKCHENTHCDLEKINQALVELTQLNDASGNSIQNGLKEVRSKQSATQDRVRSATKTILKAISVGFNDINGGVSFLGERLEASKGQIQGSFNSIEKNIKDTRNSQKNSQKLIDEIHRIIDKVYKH